MKMKIARSLAVILTGALLFSGGVMANDSTGNADADHRIAEMKKLGANMGALGKFAKGEVAYSDALIGNAKEVAAIADNLTSLFPEGSCVEASRAKQEICSAEPKAEFEGDIARLEAASDQLAVAVESGNADAIGEWVKEPGGAWGTCHKDVRKPKA